MKTKPFPKVREYLYYHKTGCNIIKPQGECSCGRNDALLEIEGATLLIDYLQNKIGDAFDLLCDELGLNRNNGIEDILDKIRELKTKNENKKS